jgi:micrococcal nuclease
VRPWTPTTTTTTAVVVVLGAAMVGCAAGHPAPPASAADPGVPVAADAFPVTVERVVDGDTLVVRRDGQRLRVRLVGIDTPESVKPDTPVACFGKEASALTRGLVQGKAVRAAYEVERTDAYGRELWDVWLQDGRLLQGVLVASGVARAYPFKPNTVHAQALTDLMRAAHDARVGLWGRCAVSEAFPQLGRQ